MTSSERTDTLITFWWQVDNTDINTYDTETLRKQHNLVDCLSVCKALWEMEFLMCKEIKTWLSKEKHKYKNIPLHETSVNSLSFFYPQNGHKSSGCTFTCFCFFSASLNASSTVFSLTQTSAQTRLFGVLMQTKNNNNKSFKCVLKPLCRW